MAIATCAVASIGGFEKMTTENDTAKAVSTAKGNVTRAEKALADAMASGDVEKTMSASADLQKAQSALASAERAHEASTREEFLEKMDDARSDVVEALNGVSESIEILRRAGMKYVDVEITGEGQFTVSTRSGQRGIQPGGTRKVERYELEIAGKTASFTAGQIIQNFGETMANYEARISQIENKDLTRKEFAREICQSLGGTVVGNTDD